MSAVAHVSAGDVAKASLINDIMPITTAVSADTTITDTVGYNIYLCTAGANGIKLTLPTAADNTNRCLEFIKIDSTDSVVMVDGEGAETINGLTHLFLTYQYQRIRIICNGTGWYVLEGKQRFRTGMISRSDWTNVHLGTVALDYDNLSGTFEIGEVITGGTSTDTGIIIADDGSTLDLIMCTSGGIFQDNEEITGSWSGATADVNEPVGGASGVKNLDCNFVHQQSINITEYKIRMLVSSDGTYANSWDTQYANFPNGAAQRAGFSTHQIDTNNCKIQTSDGGIRYIADDGTSPYIDTEDWFYEIIFEREF